MITDLKKTDKKADRIWTVTFTSLVFTTFVVSSLIQMYGTTAGGYIIGLGGNSTDIGLTISAYMLGTLLFRPLVGRILDSGRQMLPWFVGITGFSACLAGYALVKSILAFALLRFVHGIFNCLVTTAAATLASNRLPDHRMAEGMGYFALGGNLSQAFGPAVGLTIVRVYGYKPLFVGAAICCSLLIPFGAFIAGLLHKENISKASNETLSIDKAEDAHKRVPKSRFIKLCMFCSMILMFLPWSGLVTYLDEYAKFRDLGNIAYFFTITMIGGISARVFVSKLVQRVLGSFGTLVLAMIMIITGFMLAAWFPFKWTLYIVPIFTSLGSGMFSPLAQAIVIYLYPSNKRGAANAAFYMVFEIGYGLGGTAVGMVVDAWGYPVPYVFGAICTIMSLAFILAMRKSRESIDNLHRLPHEVVQLE